MRPIRYGDRRQVLTSVSDTTLILAPPMRRYFQIQGSGVQYNIQLPNALYMKVGDALVFENASPEIVGVQNSSLATWERVPPRWSITCTLQQNATAAGVWGVFWSPNPMLKNGGFSTIDFTGMLLANNIQSESSRVVATSSGSVVQNPSADPSDGQGVARLRASNVGNYALAYESQYMVLGGGCRRYNYKASRSVANSAIHEFTSRFGLGSNVVGGAHVNGVYFVNDLTAWGNFWVTRTIAAAGGNTTNISAVVPAVYPSWDMLSFEINSTGVRADFFIGTSLLFTHSVAANIPAVPVANGFGLTKIAGALSGDLYVEYAESGSYPTTQR